MPRFVFQVRAAQFPELPAIDDVLNDYQAARKAALGVYADLAKDIVAGLTDDSEWRLDVLNQNGEPIFRLGLLVEALEPAT